MNKKRVRSRFLQGEKTALFLPFHWVFPCVRGKIRTSHDRYQKTGVFFLLSGLSLGTIGIRSLITAPYFRIALACLIAGSNPYPKGRG